MKPVKLYVFPRSPNAQKVMLANTQSGLNLPLKIVDLFAGDQKHPDFLALNPNGKMPVLEFDDGSTLWESNAIVNRLAALAKSDIWPASDVRYDIMRWQFWEGCHWNPACSKFITKHLFGDDSVDLVKAEEEFARFARVLDDQLAGQDWIVGNALSTADVSIAPVLSLRGPCQYPMDGYHHIAAWISRMESLPAWQTLQEDVAAA